ncbi:MAG: nicotinate-nucleotide adenylyltransferase [Gemmatimonadaceae bacterium]
MRTGAGNRLGAEALTGVRLGIFGGTFDPPHIGHLLAASDAFEALELDRLLLVPAAAQPFKIGRVWATSAERRRMLELMAAGDPRFVVDPIEMNRGGLSYTVDTLSALSEREPDAALLLLIGEDLAGQIGSWRAPERIAALAEIVVLTRAGEPEHSSGAAAGTAPDGLRRVRTRRVDVSATEIRARVHDGHSIHGFVTEAVAGFIATSGLYR